MTSLDEELSTWLANPDAAPTRCWQLVAEMQPAFDAMRRGERCRDGQLAFERVLSEDEQDGGPYDLILMDMQMPVLDGCGATTKLRQEGC